MGEFHVSFWVILAIILGAFHHRNCRN